MMKATDLRTGVGLLALGAATILVHHLGKNIDTGSIGDLYFPPAEEISIDPQHNPIDALLFHQYVPMYRFNINDSAAYLPLASASEKISDYCLDNGNILMIPQPGRRIGLEELTYDYFILDDARINIKTLTEEEDRAIAGLQSLLSSYGDYLQNSSYSNGKKLIEEAKSFANSVGIKDTASIADELRGYFIIEGEGNKN